MHRSRSDHLDEIATDFLRERGIDVPSELSRQVFGGATGGHKRRTMPKGYVPLAAFLDLPRSQKGRDAKRKTRALFLSAQRKRQTDDTAVLDAFLFESAWAGEYGPGFRVPVSVALSEEEEANALREGLSLLLHKGSEPEEYRALLCAFGLSALIADRDAKWKAGKKSKNFMADRICAWCNAEFIARRSTQNCCTQSCAAHVAWNDPIKAQRRVDGMARSLSKDGRLERLIQGNRDRGKSAAHAERSSRANRESWADPESRQKRVAGIRAAWTNERKALLSAQAKARWADPDWAEKTASKMRGIKKTIDPKISSECKKRVWADAEWRGTKGASIISALARVNTGRALTPEQRERRRQAALAQWERKRLSTT